MRTITETKTLYKFDELSEEAQEHAHSDYLNSGDYWLFSGEATDTMKAIEGLFHITLSNWCISTYRPEYPDVQFDDGFWGNCWGKDGRDLKGNRARAFLWNNFGRVLLKPRVKYFYRDKDGRRCEGVAINSVTRKSKVFYERVYDGTCPLTGICFDNDALDPMAYFCFGVEWSDKAKRRIPSARTLRSDDKTVEDVINDCVYEMFRAFCRDVEDAESMEAFKDACEANDWEFTEDGAMY